MRPFDIHDQSTWISPKIEHRYPTMGKILSAMERLVSTYDYSSSAAYIVEPEDVERVLMAIPPEHRRRPRVLKQEIRIALADLNRRKGTTNVLPIPIDSAQFLTERILAYLGSPECESKYFRELTSWLQDGGYDEPDAAWRTRDKRADRARIQREQRRFEETG